MRNYSVSQIFYIEIMLVGFLGLDESHKIAAKGLLLEATLGAAISNAFYCTFGGKE